MSRSTAEAIAALRERLAPAQRLLVFSGAGLSTGAGIPDFRSPGGLWQRLRPIEFGDFMRSAQARDETWRRKFELDAAFGQPQPTHMQPASIFADSGAAHPAVGQIAPQPARGPSVFDEVREEVQSGGRVAYKIETAQVRCTHARDTPLLPGSGHPRTDCLTDQAELAKVPILVAVACRHRVGVRSLPG